MVWSIIPILFYVQNNLRNLRVNLQEEKDIYTKRACTHIYMHHAAAAAALVGWRCDV